MPQLLGGRGEHSLFPGRHIQAYRQGRKELGLRIFERASKSRPVELTPAGQELITYFHSIVGLYKQMSTRSAELRREGGGSLVVGYCPFIGNFHEAEMLTQFSLETLRSA